MTAIVPAAISPAIADAVSHALADGKSMAEAALIAAERIAMMLNPFTCPTEGCGRTKAHAVGYCAGSENEHEARIAEIHGDALPPIGDDPHEWPGVSWWPVSDGGAA